MISNAFSGAALGRVGETNRWVRLLIPALACLVMALLAVSTYSGISPSFDEAYNISSGLAMFQSGNYVPGYEQPPLARWPIALLPYLSGAKTRIDESVMPDAYTARYPVSPLIFDLEPHAMRRVIQGRLGVLIFIPVLLVTLYLWASRLFGPKAGIAALCLGAFSPNLLAHGALANTDFPVAAMFLLACYRTYLWMEEPTVKNGCLFAATAALAAMTKYSVVVFLPPIALLYWAGLRRNRSASKPAASRGSAQLKRGALYLAVGTIVAWACYGFAARPLSDPGRRPHAIVDRFTTPGSGLNQALYWFEENIPVPFIDTVNGLRTIHMHNSAGHRAFLLGKVREQGWWYYFPAVMAFKSTLPLLALVLLAIVLMSIDRTARTGRIFSLGAIVSVLGVSMAGSINIGVRHILPAYPFMAMLAASVFQDIGAARGFRKWLPRAAAVLVIWHIGEGIGGMPDNISYFNETVRGREYTVLGDSNLDWGQGLFELRDFVHKNQIKSITFRYFGSVDPREFGVPEAIPFPAGGQPHGWVACSVTYIQGIYEPGCRLLAGRAGISKAGRTIWIAHIP